MVKKAVCVFLLLALIQLLVPAWMIYEREIILRDGHQFKFRTAPVDPYDAFRGRYVALKMEAGTVPLECCRGVKSNQWAYALIANDAEGFAKVEAVTADCPQGDFIRTKMGWISEEKVDTTKTATINFNFNRYFLPEDLAPEAEKAYRKFSSGKRRDAYVTVRVLGGKAALEELYFGNQSIREFLRNPQVTEEVKSPAQDENLVLELIKAINSGDTAEVKKQLDKGADVNSQNYDSHDYNRWTPLMYACALGKPEIVKLILERRPQLDMYGEITPLGIARLNKYDEIVKLLEKAKAEQGF
ncbi:MAG: GDYXXLXY domain-containing protein [Candidatus Wallbacteria bacterium]|nr:GDYXXLXY domain-containing protein [Candidatus Wallbacteria bacterium]